MVMGLVMGLVMMAVVIVIAIGSMDVAVIMSVAMVMAMVVAAIGPVHMRAGMARRGRYCLFVGHGFALLPSLDWVSGSGDRLWCSANS